jgi:ribosomal protein S18 acetylase RimI-like enzyme
MPVNTHEESAIMTTNPTITTLSTATDKTGAIVEIKFCSQVSIGPTDLMSFFYRNLAELIENGHGQSWPNYNAKSMAVYVEINNVIVGHIMFSYNADHRHTFITLSAVDQAYRNRGLYKLMHYEFEKKSRQLGACQITSFVHVDNTARLASAKSVDLVPQFYKMIKDL